MIAQGGWKVHLVGRSEKNLAQATEALPQAITHQADVCLYKNLAAAFQSVFDEDKRIDFVFANAGVPETPAFYTAHSEINAGDFPPEPDLTTIAVNLEGVVFTAHLTLHYFRLSPHRGQGTNFIINSSGAGLYPAPDIPLYASAKREWPMFFVRFSIAGYVAFDADADKSMLFADGAIGLMRSITQRFQSHGIRVNAICTGLVKTKFLNSSPWAHFPSEIYVPVDVISLTILRVLRLDDQECPDQQIIEDNDGVCIKSSLFYGQTIEIFADRIYFKGPPLFPDDKTKELMEHARANL